VRVDLLELSPAAIDALAADDLEVVEDGLETVFEVAASRFVRGN
jgi:hypothetical protein